MSPSFWVTVSFEPTNPGPLTPVKGRYLNSPFRASVFISHLFLNLQAQAWCILRWIFYERFVGNTGFYKCAPLSFIKWKVKKSRPGGKKQFPSPLMQDWANQVFFPHAPAFSRISPLQPAPVNLVRSHHLCAWHTWGLALPCRTEGKAREGTPLLVSDSWSPKPCHLWERKGGTVNNHARTGSIPGAPRLMGTLSVMTSLSVWSTELIWLFSETMSLWLLLNPCLLILKSLINRKKESNRFPKILPPRITSISIREQHSRIYLLSFSVSLFLYLCVSLSLCLSPTHSSAHTNTHTHTLNNRQMDRLDGWMDKYMDWGTAREIDTLTSFSKNEIHMFSK